MNSILSTVLLILSFCFYLDFVFLGSQQIIVKTEEDVQNQDPKLSEDNQHEFFQGHVELKDAEVKDENVSVILENININDDGTY